MRGKQNDRDARCPFLLWVMKNSIQCETPLLWYTNQECNVKLVFHDDAERNLHFRTFCCKQWKYCELARAILSKYEDEDEKE